MAEIARVGPARSELDATDGLLIVMTADRLQQAVGRVRHVAVVAGAAARVGSVFRVRGQVRAAAARGTEAGLVAVHPGRQLIVRPFRDRTRILSRLVQRVA